MNCGFFIRPHNIYLLFMAKLNNVSSEGSIYSSPILVPGGVVAATLDGILALLHPDTGDTLWKTRIGHPIFASPLWHPDSRKIFVACVDHKIYSSKLIVLWWQGP